MNNNHLNYNQPILAFFGHHKCGTTWIQKIVKAVCSYLGLKHKHFHSPKMFNFDLNQTICDKQLNFISYTNADYDFVNPIVKNIKGFHVIRDPRDIIVSAYFSHRYSHSLKPWPELIDHRKQLEQVSLDEGLLLTMEYLQHLPYDGIEVNLLKSMQQWDYSRSNIMEIKFEDLIKNPYAKFLDIFDFLDILRDDSFKSKLINDLPLGKIFQLMLRRILSKVIYTQRSLLTSLPPQKVLNIIYENDFARLAKGRNVGEENIKSHYRKGQPGDWRNYFNDSHKQIFKQKFNSILLKLRYEKGYNW